MITHGIWNGEIGYVHGKSRLLQSYHQAPLKITKPFSIDSDGVMLYLMESSPGLLNGDIQEITCTLKSNAKLLFTTQSYCKLMPSKRDTTSEQRLRFFIGKGAVLEYFPEPLVPFKGASFQGSTEIMLNSGGQAILSELITPGRVGRGEMFEYQSLTSSFSVYWDGRLSLWDRIKFEPMKSPSIQELLGGYTHLLNVWILSEWISDQHLDKLREFVQTYADGSIYAGVSRLPTYGIVVRALGTSVTRLQTFALQCWDVARQQLLNKRAIRLRK
jgi:urease accessory protein